jgi:hypothetical protein
MVLCIKIKIKANISGRNGNVGEIIDKEKRDR